MPRDIAERRDYSNSRTKAVKELLVAGAWKGGTDRNVWLTEGGYDMTGNKEVFSELPAQDQTTREASQLDLVAHGINEMSRYNRATASAEVPIFSQYQLYQVETVDSFETGMTRAFVFQDYNPNVPGAEPVAPGPLRPIATRWPGLPDELS